ncbi:hypothetical protein FRC09_003732, partial [Ceratobasidium sp. 395]
MFAKLKRGLRLLKRLLIKPFRGRSRSHNLVQSTRLDPIDWDGLRFLTTSLNQTTNVPRLLITAVAKLRDCIETFDDEARAHSEYGSLRADLNDLFRELSGYLHGAVSSSPGQGRVGNLAQCLDTVVKSMRLKQGEGETGKDNEIKEEIGGILQAYGRIRVVIIRFVLSEKTRWGEVNEADYVSHTATILDSTKRNHLPQDHALARLPQSTAARYDSSDSYSTGRNGCTPNTCAGVLQQLHIWASYNNHQKLYWLNGTPGTGKTTIAYSFCEELKSAGKLAASFFCARWSSECRDAKAILPSISYQLALFSRPFLCAISNTFDQAIDLQTLSIQDQFERLIVTPLRIVGYTFPTGVVVVVDALDECENQDIVDQILGVLPTYASTLPIKFLTTSRPRSNLLYRIRSEEGNDAVLESRLSTLDPSLVRQDIKTFMEAELSATHPSTDGLEHLVNLSDSSFYQAAVLVRYITHGYHFGSAERTRRLQQLLNSSAPANNSNGEGMDPVYNAMLEAALESDSFGGPQRAETERLIHTVICAREPLPADALAGLLSLNITRLERYLLQASKLLLQVSEEGRLVTTRHKTFSSYLLDQRRSGKYYCDPERCNVWLAQTCFNLIKESTTRPPGPESHMATQQDDLPSQLNGILDLTSPHCLYACRYWSVHAQLVDRSEPKAAFETLRQVLEESDLSDVDMFYTRLLRWVSSNATAENTIDRMMKVLGTVTCAQEDLALSDIKDWTGVVAAELISSLAPVLSVSEGGKVSVLHSSFSSYLFDIARSGAFYCDPEQYHTRLTQACFDLIKLPDPPFNICGLPSSYVLDRDVPGIQETASMRISSRLLYACKYWGHHTRLAGYSTNLSATLHDIVATRLLLSMEVLNLRSANCEGSNMLRQLHKWLQTVRFEDTIRDLVHDAWQFLERFSGSPASQNGAYIASGSDDNTVRIWEARNGQPVGQPLKGHGRAVTSVAYSPDGSHIASGSYENTIRIWDAKTGQPIGQPLEGHTGWVWSVAYSPDGAFIASGSDDLTVRIWDTHSGQPIGQPLEGHALSVQSVAYSPDGAHIASGSRDTTVRIWDAKTGQAVGRLLQGDTHPVYSVAYSPDGAYIVSGSSDGTIRIWDTKTGRSVGQPLTGHRYKVYTVTYSPNGEYIAFGSADKTTRIWDASTGQLVGQPLKGHASGVTSVSFSPDGKRLVSGSDDHTIRVWDVSGTPAVEALAERESAVTQSVSGPLDRGSGNPQGSSVSPTPYDYELNDDGWLIGPGGERIVWAPGNLM